MQSSNNYFQLIMTLQENIDWLNKILIGNDNESIVIGGVVKPSISKSISDKWSAISAMVQGRQAYETKSALPVSPPNGVLLVEVWRDPVKDNNGLYGWTGVGWEKSPFGNPINQIVPDDQSQPITGYAVHSNNENIGVNYLLPKQIKKKPVSVSDLAANYCTVNAKNDEILIENVSGYCWVNFNEDVNYFETYIKNNGWTRFIGIGTYKNGIIALTLGTGFGSVYYLTNTTITKVDSFDVSDKEMLPNFSTIKVSLIEEEFVVLLDKDGSGNFVDWLNINLKDIHPVENYRLSIAYIGSSDVTVLKAASSAVDTYSKIQEKSIKSVGMVENHDREISEMRLANRHDFNVVQGDGITIKNGELISNRYSGDWPVIMFSDDVTEVELTCTDEFYGVMLGFDHVESQGTFVAMGKSSGARTVSDVKGSVFNINTSSLDPAAYGLPLQGKTPEKVVNGDVLNVKIINKNTVELKVYRQGSSEVKINDVLIVDRRVKVNRSDELIGWNMGLKLGVLCLSSGANIKLASNVKIRKRGLKDNPNVLPSRWLGKKYYALGDSITGVGSKFGRGHCHIIERQLGISRLDYLSKSGRTIPQLYALRDEFITDMDLVTIYAGVNDYIFQAPVGSQDSVDVSTTRGALRALLAWYAENSPTATIAVIGPSRMWGWTENGNREPDDMTNAGRPDSTGVTPLVDYVDAIQDVCNEFGCASFDLYHDYHLNRYNMDKFTYDGLHPNWIGDERLGYAMASFLAGVG